MSPAPQSRSGTVESSTASRFVFEAALIVLSILLAFVLNEWRESRRDAATVREATARIATEVEHNIAALDSVISYHEGIVARVNALLDSLAHPGVREQLKAPPTLGFLGRLAPEGLRPPELRTAAWRASEVGGTLPLFDADRLQAIAAAYQSQLDGVQSTMNRLTTSILAPERFSQESLLLLRYLQAEMGNLVGQERFHRATLSALSGSLRDVR